MHGLKRKAGSVALAVGAYAVLRVVGVIEAPESWTTYAPHDAGYSILTPGSMRESTETIPTMNVWWIIVLSCLRFMQIFSGC